MGKRGPCYHCGIDTTPLWRNGPPEKPVLCNACGSRYRLRGTLLNYTPKHLMVIPSSNKNKNKNKNKRRNTIVKTENNFSNSFRVPATATASDHEADVSNKSTSLESQTSSGSTTSLSSYHGDKTSNGSQLPGNIHRSLWDFHIPSRTRSLVLYRRLFPILSPIEQLQKDLSQIFKHEGTTILRGPQDGVLLYNTNNQIAPTEIGLGSILLKNSTTPHQT